MRISGEWFEEHFGFEEDFGRRCHRRRCHRRRCHRRRCHRRRHHRRRFERF